MTKAYLAGPMRGIPQFNFPAFHAAAAYLRNLGIEVFSPAERDEGKYGADFSQQHPDGDEVAATLKGFDIREAMLADVTWICQHADMIVLLPGWENSSGAKAERALGEAIRIPVQEYANAANWGR